MAGSRTVLGVDEAGRGSLIGPLVVGGFLTDERTLPTLRGLGVADSKLLSPRTRAEVYRRLREVGRRLSVEIPPARVDAYVRHGRLNLLEAETFAEIVRRARPSRVEVDACDPVALRFGALVRRLAGGKCPVHAAHRADRDLPVVGAASIVAKVRRDRAVAGLRRRLGVDFGSGYPVDERTVDFVRTALHPGAPDPPWLRSTWSTTERLKRARPGLTLETFAP